MPARLLIAMAKLGAQADREADRSTRDFVYDLTRDYPGRVPDQALVYKPSQRDLAKIDARYYNVRTTARAPATGTT